MTRNAVPNTLSTARLAARQKRLQDLTAWAATELQDPTIKPRFDQLLASYGKALRKAWEAGEVSPELELEVSSLERELQEIDNESRMRVTGGKGRR